MLTRLQLERFKSWYDTEDIALAPITGLFGANSGGKTSLIQSLLLLKQTADSRDRTSIFHFGDERTYTDLEDFQSVIHGHYATSVMKLALDWTRPQPFEIYDTDTNRRVVRSGRMGFEVASRQVEGRSGMSLAVEKMSYRAGDAVFGIGRVPRDKRRSTSTDTKYDLFADAAFPDGTEFKFKRRRGRPWKAFPTSKCYGFSDRVRSSFQNAGFLSDLEFALEECMGSIYYVGPLRVPPERRYTWVGEQPDHVGQAGERAVQAILAAEKRGDRIGRGRGRRKATLEEYTAHWLRELGLIHEFRVVPISEDRRVFEVRIRKSSNPKSTEVLITDVGFGVSQVLPVIVQCFYVPKGSTVIFEQPDIHLHPSVQAGLADVFIDAWKKRGVQIIVESHSEHLLNRLQRRIAEYSITEKGISQDNVGLSFCSAGDGASRLTQLKLDAYGNIKNWPKDFFGDQFGEIAAMADAAMMRQGYTT